MTGATKAAPLPLELLTDVFRRCRPRLVRLLTRHLQSAAAAEDIAQEAYLRLAASSTPVLNAEAYLTQTALNLANTHARLESRRAVLRAEAHALLWEGLEEPDAERVHLAAEELQRAAEVFACLPTRTREIMELTRIEGLCAREVAERLGLSTRAVEKHVARGTQALAAALDRHVRISPRRSS
ncbi:MAG: RNA polymerase sigma factor [Gammaproteobacteria bacterium]